MKNKEIEERKYYVYIHIRPDNNTTFYVGKGKGYRYIDPRRNNLHEKIVEKLKENGMDFYTTVIKDKLTEKEAFELEEKMIDFYMYELGYGIDVIGLRGSIEEGFPYLTNFTLGGEGSSGAVNSNETRRKKSESAKIAQNRPEQRKANSEAVKAMWENSEMIKNQKEAKMKKVNQNAICIYSKELDINFIGIEMLDNYVKKYLGYKAGTSDFNKILRETGFVEKKFLTDLDEKINITFKKVDNFTSEEDIRKINELSRELRKLPSTNSKIKCVELNEEFLTTKEAVKYFRKNYLEIRYKDIIENFINGKKIVYKDKEINFKIEIREYKKKNKHTQY